MGKMTLGDLLTDAEQTLRPTLTRVEMALVITLIDKAYSFGVRDAIDGEIVVHFPMERDR